jgi:hypothetical protein
LQANDAHDTVDENREQANDLIALMDGDRRARTQFGVREKRQGLLFGSVSAPTQAMKPTTEPPLEPYRVHDQRRLYSNQVAQTRRAVVLVLHDTSQPWR